MILVTGVYCSWFYSTVHAPFNPQFVYFLALFLKTRNVFQGVFFIKFWPYIHLVFKSNFKSRAGYSGARTVYHFWLLETKERKNCFPVYHFIAMSCYLNLVNWQTFRPKFSKNLSTVWSVNDGLSGKLPWLVSYEFPDFFFAKNAY